MLRFALRTTTERPPAGYVGLIGLSGGGLATVDASGTVTPLQGGGAVSVSVAWAGLTGKPSSYPPSVHSHVPSEITGLQAMLDSISAGGVADIAMPTSATAQVLVFGNINAALLAAVGGLPNTTQSYPSRIRGTFIAGASPSGTVKVKLASETAGTTVTAKAGSFIKWREI